MTKEQLSDACNWINDDILEETDAVRGAICLNADDMKSRTDDMETDAMQSSADDMKTDSGQSSSNDAGTDSGQNSSGHAAPDSAQSTAEHTESNSAQSIANYTKSKTTHGNRKHAKKYLAAAACLALALLAGAWLLPRISGADSEKVPEPDGGKPTADLAQTPQSSSKPPAGTSTALPKITLNEYAGYDTGFGTLMAYDISELINANPWTDTMEMSTLPVYKNRLTFRDGYYLSADYDGMRALLLETAERLGLDTAALTITDNAPDEQARQEITEKYEMSGDTVPEGCFAPTSLSAEADGIKIEVDYDMDATITFEPAAPLPDKYHFTGQSTYDELQKAAGYLQKAYKELLDMKHPVVNISGGHYDIYRNQSYELSFFDTGKNDAETILNYNFKRVVFYGDEQGGLRMVRIYRPNFSEKLGDYPIITPGEAETLLRDGTYFTQVTEDLPKDFTVARVELGYREGPAQEYYLPYYRFYIEVADAQEKSDHDMKHYGMYDVPAVAPEYLADRTDSVEQRGFGLD